MPKIKHVTDRTFFWDAIDWFEYEYTWYSEDEYQVDELGRDIVKYKSRIICGSLQSQGTSLQQSLDGNREQMKYKFFCKNKYRIKIGDYIYYMNRFLMVDSVFDYDEFGVRSCDLTMTNLTNLKDLEETQEFLDGERII